MPGTACVLGTLIKGGSMKILYIGPKLTDVEEGRREGEAYACELNGLEADLPFSYRAAFTDIGFPVDAFDKVVCRTCPDAANIGRIVDEVFRITKQGGKVQFDSVWMLDAAGKAGFKVEADVCTKPPAKRVTILVPPGIGDSFWTIVKTESFLEQNKLGIPEIIPVSNRMPRLGGVDRAVPFIQMFPFLTSTHSMAVEDPSHRQIWHEGYMQTRRSIFRNVMGCDYFLCWNGYQRIGKSLEEI